MITERGGTAFSSRLSAGESAYLSLVTRALHARFERDLIERFQPRLTVRPAPPSPVRNIRAAAFDALLASYQLVDPILKADTEAIAGKDAYDDDYFEQFFVKVRLVL